MWNGEIVYGVASRPDCLVKDNYFGSHTRQHFTQIANPLIREQERKLKDLTNIQIFLNNSHHEPLQSWEKKNLNSQLHLAIK